MIIETTVSCLKNFRQLLSAGKLFDEKLPTKCPSTFKARDISKTIRKLHVTTVEKTAPPSQLHPNNKKSFDKFTSDDSLNLAVFVTRIHSTSLAVSLPSSAVCFRDNLFRIADCHKCMISLFASRVGC